MTATRRSARSARAAEPTGIGSASARDPLAVEVRLLGSLLGQVITEQAGQPIYDLVERLRLAAIAFRKDDDPLVRDRL
jgi:phosphoenolpyruvate carboxylase